jgi:hypothetical protein
MEMKPRDILDVYEQITKEIPEQHNELKLTLKTYIESLWNIAPEIRTSRNVYVPFATIMENYVFTLPTTNEEWVTTIQKIFRGDLAK